jgi:hypothetical protein
MRTDPCIFFRSGPSSPPAVDRPDSRGRTLASAVSARRFEKDSPDLDLGDGRLNQSIREQGAKLPLA